MRIMNNNNYSGAIMSIKAHRMHADWVTREFVNSEFAFFGNDVTEFHSLDLARIIGIVWQCTRDRFILRF